MNRFVSDSDEEIAERTRLVLQSVMQEYFTLVNFEFFYKKVFYFDPKITQSLMETAVDVEGDLLHLPFPSCAFIFQDPQMIKLLHQCFGSTDIVPEYETPISVFLSEIKHEGYRSLVIMATRLSDNGSCYIMLKRELKIEHDKSIADALRTVWGEPDTSSYFETMADEFFFDDLRMSFFRTIVNCILYLSTSNPEIMKMNSPVENLRRQLGALKSSKKKAKMERRLASMVHSASSLPYIHIGRTYRPPLPPEASADVDAQQYRKIMKRFMVKGHLRAQAYGKERSLRKVLWIEPFWKGPNNLDEIFGNKPYIVD